MVPAGALLVDRPILLLDKPTSGLEPGGKAVTRNFFGRRKKQNRLTPMRSDLVPEIAETCDEVIFLDRGRIPLQDSVERFEKWFRIACLEVECPRSIPPEALRDCRVSRWWKAYPPPNMGSNSTARRRRGPDGSKSARGSPPFGPSVAPLSIWRRLVVH
jgi:energy-coupling factor transporter ATP-binding protein EcfA2